MAATLEPRLIVGSRRVAWIGAVGSALFLALGVWLGLQFDNPALAVLGWICAAVFAVVLARWALAWLRPAQLLLDAEGMTLRASWKPATRYRWNDIDGFRLVRFRASTLVEIVFKPGRAPQSWVARASRLTGVGGALPPGWTMPPQDLVQTLADYKARADAVTRDT
jgi:hypothetical protein